MTDILDPHVARPESTTAGDSACGASEEKGPPDFIK